MLEGLPIITERLILNPFAESDAPFLNQLMNTPGYLKYIGDRKIRTDEKAADYIREKLIPSYEISGFGFYIVRLRHMDFPIGLCGMTKRDNLEAIDLGFGFLDDYHGQGYAYEASKGVMEHAQEYHGVKRLIAVTTEDNLLSRRLLAKLGFSVDKFIKWTDGEETMQYECIL